MDTGHPDASIRLISPHIEARFEWFGFDGDDGFIGFRLLVSEADSSRTFEFGGCANYGLRKLTRFVNDPTQIAAGLGFRHPDIRYLDIFRADGDVRIVVRFEGSHLHEEFLL